MAASWALLGSGSKVRIVRRLRLVLVLSLLVGSGLVVPPRAAQAQVIDTVTVDSSSTEPVASTTLTAGETYTVTVEGTFAYGHPIRGQESGVADAECSTLPPDPTYQRARYVLLDPSEDFLDLYLGQNGNLEPAEWEATNPDPFGCNSSDHTYSLTFEAEADAPLEFVVKDIDEGAYQNNQGTLTVEISQPEEILLETIDVPVKHAPEVSSTTSLDPDKRYRLVASGTYDYGNLEGVPLGRADAECSFAAADTPATWQRDTYKALDPGGDQLDLYVNANDVAWQPTNGSPTGCNTDDHTYAFAFTGVSGQLALQVRDMTNSGDNIGSLQVELFEVTVEPPEASSAALPGLPETEFSEEVQVDSRDENGSFSAIPVREGEQLFMRVEGTYAYGRGMADARCSNKASHPDDPDPTFRPSEENYPDLDPRILQLLINDQAVDWQPPPDKADSLEPECSVDHSYQLAFVAPSSGLLNFRILDGNYRDNSGTLTVEISRIQEVPAGTVFVPSNMASGALTPPLVGGESYRLEASGTYSYFDNLPNTLADAECSQGYSSGPPFTGLPDDPTFEPHRYGSGEGDLLDLVVDGEHVEWSPEGGSEDCDADHVYSHVLAPSGSGPAGLVIDDTNYGDNSGELRVDVFIRTS